MAGIELERVTKRFAGDVVAVDDVSLEIEDGEFVVLVGPSGCGKSTLLRMIAGLEEVSEGRVCIDGRDVTDWAPRLRDVAMVFQTYALYPHMTVRQNLGYGLKVRRTPKDEVAKRVDEVAALLGLAELLERRPAALSGGQRQRVAMGRAIVREPKAFLMDEPLSNLDAKLRVGMRASLAQLHDRLGVTSVYVTHDQIEAMTLGQRVAVMRDGKLLQVDAPQRLYREPRNVFVAAFIGSPAMNLVDATVDGDDVLFGEFRVPLAPGRRPQRGVRRVVLGVRPESFEDAALAPRGKPTLETTARVVEELGSEGDPADRPGRSPHAGAAGGTPAARGRSRALPLLRPGERRQPPRPRRGDRRARPRGRDAMTKQREARERVLDLIERLGVGDAIPSERQLSVDLGMSRLTVRAALDELVREGYLVRRRGAGTFVSEPKIAQELTMTSFTDDMRERGLHPGSRTLEAGIVSAGARLGRLLHVSPSEPVFVAKRLRLADGEAMAIEDLHVRSSLVPGLTGRELEEHSFYALLRDRYDITPVGGVQTVEPTVTNEEESELLGIPLHSPAFLFERITRAGDGRVVEYVRSIYRGDRYRLVSDLGVQSDGGLRRRPSLDATGFQAVLRPAAGLGEIGLDKLV